MSKLLIKNANVILTDRILENHSVMCDQGKIVQISSTVDCGNKSVMTITDANGQYLSPGFIDLHFHGLHKYLIDNGLDHLENICKILPQYGVTSFLPTVCPKSQGEDVKFVKSLSRVKLQGAQILGFHFEGPFLALTGILPYEALSEICKERIGDLIEAAKPYPAIFSISPEVEHISNLISIIAKVNVPVFITHIKASVQQTQASIEAGARHATHFYDVFPCPPEVDPGVRPCGAVEAILADERVSVDFILDGEHVDPVTVKMALVCKGPDKVCLITDSNVGAGLPPGKYSGLNNMELEFAYPGSPARTTKASRHPGCLAGSGLTMERAVQNATKMLKIDLPLAIKMASANPARVLSRNDIGSIEIGKQAYLVLMNKDLKVVQTWLKGEFCYKAN